MAIFCEVNLLHIFYQKSIKICIEQFSLTNKNSVNLKIIAWNN